jgi:ribonuclease PH
MTRTDGRSYDALRPVTIETGVQRNPEGSVLYRCGGTTVLIAASVSEGVPDRKSSGSLAERFAPRSISRDSVSA